MVNLTRFFSGFILILVVLHVWAAAFPSHFNWGFHYFAFYPPVQSLAALAPVLFILWPRTRAGMISQLGAVARGFAKLPPVALLGLLLAGWIGLILLFPAKLHLLGDSEIILALTPNLPSIADASANFRNQPLTYEALRLLQWILGAGSSVEPARLYAVADGIAGVLYLGLVFHFLRSMRLAAVDAMLLGALLLFRVGTQFFFGYVENYMFFYVALTAYVVTGWLALEGKGPLWLPLVALASAPAFHLAGAVFLPSSVLLLAPSWKGRRRLVLAAAGGITAACAAIAWHLGPSWLVTRVVNAFQYDLLPLWTPDNGVPYGMLSWPHLVDWLNANAHIAPFSLACAGIGFALVPRADYAGSPVFRFLLWATVTGLGASFVILPGLGMARDWDMLSNFFVPLRFFSVYFLLLFLRSAEARHAVAMLAVVGLVRWAGWIGINADESRHLARAEVLTVPALSGTFPKLYYENLGKVFYERAEYRRAAAWYERYLGVDSANPRILANLSDCYRALGDSANVFRMLELSVAAGTSHPGVYSNLAVEYIARRDTARAVELLNEALERSPAHFETLANLSILELARGEYRESLRHSVTALRLGMTDPVLFRNAGFACYFLDDYEDAVGYFDRYLQSVPTDAQVGKLAADLKAFISRGRR